MKLNNTKRKTYQIEYKDQTYSITMEIQNSGILIRDFKPPELNKFKQSIFFENEDEFIRIWLKYIMGLYVCKEENDIIERNIGALTFITMDHVEENGFIDDKTLFKFLDCYSNVLFSQGMPLTEIKKAYLPVAKGLIDCFDEKVIDSENGNRFKDSSNYLVLLSLIEKGDKTPDKK